MESKTPLNITVISEMFSDLRKKETKQKEEEYEKSKLVCREITESYRQMLKELINDISNNKDKKIHEFEKSKVMNFKHLNKKDLFRFSQCNDLNELIEELGKSETVIFKDYYCKSLADIHFHLPPINTNRCLNLSIQTSTYSGGCIKINCEETMFKFSTKLF